MRLINLLDGNLYHLRNEEIIKDIEITGLTCDSRKVNPGFLFAAIPGSNRDGRDYIDEAFERGASIVMAPIGTSGDGYGKIVTSKNIKNSCCYWYKWENFSRVIRASDLEGAWKPGS